MKIFLLFHHQNVEHTIGCLFIIRTTEICVSHKFFWTIHLLFLFILSYELIWQTSLKLFRLQRLCCPTDTIFFLTTKHFTDKYIRHTHTHTHRQHTATYQINNLTTQTSREGSNSTKNERRPPEDGQTIVTETCRVLMMCFTNIFNNLVF